MAAKKTKSFYSSALDEAERVELRSAAAQDGIDAEIAVLRFKIKQLVKVVGTDELARCTNALCRALLTRYSLEGKNKKNLKEAFGNVLREVLMPLSINRSEISVSLLKK
jgi:hypothetical protein